MKSFFKETSDPSNLLLQASLLGVLLLVSLLLPGLAQRRGRGRRPPPSRQSFANRGGRELAGYGAAASEAQSQYQEADEGGCESPPDDGGNGVDFSGCEEDPDTGFCCVEKIECVASVKKDPILECTHKNVEQCHYTYVTTFSPSQEEVCEETYQKTCSITFTQQAYNETVRKCYTPVEKVCNGQGPDECTTVYESSCTTKYVEKRPGKFVGDTKCEKLPIELCGKGCSFEEGPEECHDKQIVSVVEQPEEVCDLNPQKTCRYATKLVPKLMPKHECTIVPKETCLLKFTTPRQISKPLLTKWCLDPAEPETGNYDEDGDSASASASAPQSYGVPPPASSSYASPSRSGYDSPVFDPAPSIPFPPTGSYGAALPSSQDYSYDYDYGASSQASDTYSDYEAPPADTGYSAPAAVASGYGAPAPAPGGYGAPTASASGYGAPTSAAGDYGAPASASAAYGSPASPGGGYDAPAAGGYSAPLDEAYSSPDRRRSKKLRGQESRRSKTVLPKRTFSGRKGV